MANRGQINQGQVGVFVKCLTLVPVYRLFYKNKPLAARNKGFGTYVDSKPKNLESRITIQLYKKPSRLKSLNKCYVIFENDFTTTQEPVFLIYFI